MWYFCDTFILQDIRWAFFRWLYCEYFNFIGNKVESKYGTFILNRTGVKSSISAPIHLGDEDYYFAAVINVEKEKNSFYLHEVAILNKKKMKHCSRLGIVKRRHPAMFHLPYIVYSISCKMSIIPTQSFHLTLAVTEISSHSSRRSISKIQRCVTRTVIC